MSKKSSVTDQFLICARRQPSHWGHFSFCCFWCRQKWVSLFQTFQTTFGLSLSSEYQRKNFYLVKICRSLSLFKESDENIFQLTQSLKRSDPDPTCAFFISQYDGPLRAMHTMMVDPNGIIKKLGSKDLPVTPGEIVDIIHFTNSKKALCLNQFGKCTQKLWFGLF